MRDFCLFFSSLGVPPEELKAEFEPLTKLMKGSALGALAAAMAFVALPDPAEAQSRDRQERAQRDRGHRGAAAGGGGQDRSRGGVTAEGRAAAGAHRV